MLKILHGEHELIQENYSQDLKCLLKEILTVNPDNRPDLNKILEKPFLMKYIKMNVVKQISNMSNRNKKSRQHDDSRENKENPGSQFDGQELAFNLDSKISENSSFKSREKTKIDFNENKTSTASSYEKNNTEKHINQEVVILSKIESKTKTNFIHNLSEGFTKISEKESEIQVNPVALINISDNLTIEDKNSIFCKIEKLKKFLEDYLGLECFLKIYTLLSVC